MLKSLSEHALRIINEMFPGGKIPVSNLRNSKFNAIVLHNGKKFDCLAKYVGNDIEFTASEL